MPHLILQTPQNYLYAGLHLRTSALLPVIQAVQIPKLFFGNLCYFVASGHCSLLYFQQV